MVSALANLDPTHVAISAALAGAIIFLVFGRKKVAKALNPREYQDFELVKKDKLTHNTYLLRFALQTKDTVLGLPVGKHITMKNPEGDARPYTPVSSDDDKGHVDFVIKVYPDGKMTQHLEKMNVGQKLPMRGPMGKIVYAAPGRFDVGTRTVKSTHAKHICMVAGGTGITPHLQVIRQVVKDAKDNTKVSLIFGNVSEDDILCRKELEEVQKHDNVDVFFVVDKHDNADEWKKNGGGVGYVTADMLQERFGDASDDKVVGLCGPKIMCEIVEKTLTDKLNWKPERILKF